ncbi:hypothetical protein DDE83_000073 [Stemphylium lycopersici]|uniref:DUF3176 domain containing protein n=1 Tax=Stemphylium lycopersici TaxID=183478 RepID=A0A364NGT5_STELY|nr:hypothetical protein DDE83_000073 [Stemphylium lycopersici]
MAPAAPDTGQDRVYRFPERLLRNSLNNGRDTASSPGSTTPKTSLDLTQRLERKLAEYNASQNVFKRWLFEIASWLVSALCMGAIVGIYIRISGQKMVESEQLLTLSNVLGKIASAALIVPTSEALGQLKWNWFHESNAMWDFDIFDKASRGPWGAALLLFRTKGRSLAALGALLIVLLLAIDTFFQQVVTYPDQWALSSSSSSIPVVQKYDPPYLTYFQQGFEIGQYDHISGPVVKKYFYENGTQPVFVGRGPRPEIPLSCPSSSCHWPEYDTLATCSSCVEVSERLDITYACLDRAVEWSADWLGPLQDVPYPNATVCGHYLNITSNTPILLAGHVVQDNGSARAAGEALLMRTIPLADFDTRNPYYGNGSISFKNIQYPIFDGLIASAADGVESVYRHEPPVVNECILSWCVQRMKSSYEWGVYSESIQSTFLNIVTDPGTWPWIVNGSEFTYTENITFTVPASEQASPNPDGSDVTYSVWNETAFQIMAIWDDFFPAYYTANNATSRPRLRFKNYEAGPSTRFLDFNPWLAPNNVSRHYERLATDLTNVIRSNDNSNKMVFGQAFNMEKFVKISWPWLAFPFFLLVLSLAFLVSTIIKTSKDTSAGLWKTSAMPTLIYSLPKETRSKLNPLSELTPQYRFPDRLSRKDSRHERNGPGSSESATSDKPPLDLTQRLERKLARYNASQNVFLRWLFEIASWIVSALCMGGVIGIYIRLNHTPMAQAEKLLTLANILGKIASAALIIPTSEALGQLKWHWFHDSQAMWDFEIFDKASRGAWGAALLLLRTKGRSLAALGAVLIVLLLAIDTFFQQVVTLPDTWTRHQTPGEIPYVVRYAPLYQMEFLGGWETTIYNTDLQPVVQEFLYRNGTQPTPFGSGNRPEIPLSCPTSNCTWPTYNTLAVCGSCEEVSDRLDITFACLDTKMDWSTHWEGPLSVTPYAKGEVCGHFLNITAEQPILLSGYAVSGSEANDTNQEALLFRTIPLTALLTKERLYGVGSVAFKNIRNPILDGLISSAIDGPESVYQNKTPAVHECFLSWCVKTIKSSYDLGVYHEEVLSSHYNATMGPSPWDSYVIPEDQGGGWFVIYKENVTIKSPESGPEATTYTNQSMEYGADNVTAANFMTIFDDFFPASYSVDNLTAIPRLRYKNLNLMEGPSQRFLPYSPWMLPNNLTRHVERLATAMTDRVRSTESNQMLLGEASYTEKYVLVQWAYLIFPLLLLTLTLVFLVSTIVKTSKDTSTGIWKTSAMPTLMYSLPKETRSKVDPTSTWNNAHESGKKLRIKLLPNKGWRVSGASHLSTSPQQPRPAVQAPRGWI